MTIIAPGGHAIRSPTPGPARFQERIDGGEMGAKRIGRATGLTTRHEGDRTRRQHDTRVVGADLRIIPLAHGAREDFRKRFAPEPQPLVHAGQVVGNHDHPCGDGHMHDTAFGPTDLGVRHRSLCGAKLHGTPEKAPNAFTAAGRLVLH